MARKLSYYIKERNNPQFKKPYYVAKGQMTKAEAMKVEDGTGYGTNFMLPYKTEAEYNQAIADLRAQGFNVTGENLAV